MFLCLLLSLEGDQAETTSISSYIIQLCHLMGELHGSACRMMAFRILFETWLSGVGDGALKDDDKRIRAKVIVEPGERREKKLKAYSCEKEAKRGGAVISTLVRKNGEVHQEPMPWRKLLSQS